MSDTLDGGVRGGVRRVGGWLLEAVVARADLARVEVLRRGSRGEIGWSFRHPAPALFWFRSGINGLQLDVDGQRIGRRVGSSTALCFLPTGTRVDGEFSVDPVAEYTVAFLSPALVARRPQRIPDVPLIGFAHGRLERSLGELGQAIRRRDPAPDLLLDGWALQSLAHLGGLADPERGAADDVVLRVDRFVRANLAERLDNDLLAALAGFSRRHFIRAFTERGGTTPMRYVHRVRLEEARVLLNDTDLPVAAIAARCGFSHAQHLSTSFRRDTGLTPSQFRSHASR